MKAVGFLAVLFLLGGCSPPEAHRDLPDPSPPPQALRENAAAVSSYEEVRSAAVDAIRRAAESGNVWTTSDILLKQAEEAAVAGDRVQAMELAERARVQAELAVTQTESEKRMWRERVLSN